MIRIQIVRRAVDRTIQAVYVEGHAGYARSGEDIVCAGVSAVTVGTVNSVLQVLDVRLDHTMDKGLLHIAVPDQLDQRKQQNVQLLLESMIVMLETIRKTYGKYVTIENKQT